MGKKKIDLTFNKDNPKYYYGIPNYHSNFSTGNSTPVEAFEYAYKSRLDFMFITDHNSYLSDMISIKDNKDYKFQFVRYYASKIRKKYDNFIPLVGFETKTYLYGNFNIMNSDNFFTGLVTDLKILALWMMNNPEAFISIHHPQKNIKALPFSPLLNKIITSIEVGNCTSNFPNVKYDKYYFSLLDDGWKLGAINGQHNTTKLCDCENLTVCISNNLSKKDIIEAFRLRRTYSSESKYLKFHFTIDDNFMGEEFHLKNNLIKFSIFCEDIKYKIKEIHIISNKGVVIKKIDDINLSSIKYLFDHEVSANESWYVVKLIQDNDKTAYSSPIFISR